MALVLFDRVQETTTTSGTGSVTLLGAVAGFQSFAVVGNTNTCYYTITDGSAWEVGIGTYSTSGPTLARTTVLSNSNGNTSAITLSGGTSNVFLTYPAEKSVNLNASGNVSPLGTISSGTWQGTTVGVAYGGTGVTASSGGNSVVLRDVNENTVLNNIFRNITSTVSAAGTTTLTVASSFAQILTGTTTQTYKLPDATTLNNGASFQFNNNSTGALFIVNNGSNPIHTIAAGGAAQLFLTSISTANGTWDTHGLVPENIQWGTNSLYLASDIITGGTWNGGTIGTAYGGTGLTSFTSGGALYATSTSSLTSGTLPITAGGTGLTALGTAGQVLTVNSGATGLQYSTPATTSQATATTLGTVYGNTRSATPFTTAYGYNAGPSITSGGTSNAVFGYTAAFNLTSGDQNTLIGNEAGYYMSSGSYNTAVGWEALAFGGGNYNTTVGHLAGSGIVGSRNTCIGADSGAAIDTGSNNVIIGSYNGSAAPISTTGSNYIVLSDGAGTVRQTINSSGALAFDTSGASYGTAGQVLQSNGSSAVPTWVTPSGGGGSSGFEQTFLLMGA